MALFLTVAEAGFAAHAAIAGVTLYTPESLPQLGAFKGFGNVSSEFSC